MIPAAKEDVVVSKSVNKNSVIFFIPFFPFFVVFYHENTNLIPRGQACVFACMPLWLWLGLSHLVIKILDDMGILAGKLFFCNSYKEIKIPPVGGNDYFVDFFVCFDVVLN